MNWEGGEEGNMRVAQAITCVTTVNVARNALLYNAAYRHGDWPRRPTFSRTPPGVCVM
jgi:hypothetical protein